MKVISFTPLSSVWLNPDFVVAPIFTTSFKFTIHLPQQCYDPWKDYITNIKREYRGEDGCVKWIVNLNEVVKIGATTKSGFSSLGYISRGGIARWYGNSVFNFWGASILFSTVVAPFYNPMNKIWGFQFLHILIHTSYFLGSFFFFKS